MQAALDHLRAQGETLNDEDIARLSPLPRTYQYARPLFLHAGRTGDQRTSETIKKRRQRRKRCNVSFRSTERQTLNMKRCISKLIAVSQMRKSN